MNTPTLEQIRAALAKKGYQYLDDSRPYHLNIIGIRASSPLANTFDDLLTVIYRDEERLHYIYMACTTKPGLYYLYHPDNPNGVAILVPGQYLNLFSKGMHKGQYPCLVQNGALHVYRDNRRDGAFDYTDIFPAPPESGLEIHHANGAFASIEVNSWSAGCQVVADPKSFGTIVDLVDKSINIRGNHFSYTLLSEKEIV
jgi:hypothetical protein